MVPINLEYGAWFAVIDATSTSETDPVSLHDHLLCKPWFLRIELVDHNKCLLLTTKPNLLEARNWINANLEVLIQKSIPAGIDPPSSQLPRRLKKPVFSASSPSYADTLKKQFSLVSTAANSTTDHTWPPRKWQAAIINYNSDQSSSAANLSTPAEKSHPALMNVTPPLLQQQPKPTTTPTNSCKSSRKSANLKRLLPLL